MKFSTLVFFFSNHQSGFPNHEQVIEQESFFGMFQGYVECFLDFSIWCLQPNWKICAIIVKLDGSSSPDFFRGEHLEKWVATNYTQEII